MAAAIPEVRSYRLRTQPAAATRPADYAVAAVVDDEAGLSAYLDSTAHQQTYTDWFSWMIESREAAQLEVDRATLA